MELKQLKMIQQTAAKVYSIKYFYLVIGQKWFWFRLFGRGLYVKHKSLGLLFSEEYRYTKYYKLGNWIVKTLKPKK